MDSISPADTLLMAVGTGEKVSCVGEEASWKVEASLARSTLEVEVTAVAVREIAGNLLGCFLLSQPEEVAGRCR